jgi:ribulose-phosphate 3-epimerase
MRARLAEGPIASVGIAAADPLNLGDALAELRASGTELLHVDVMDGVFCPGQTGGPALVKVLPDGFGRDVHLMVDEPLEKFGAYVDAGADIITVHVEATRHPHRVLQALRGGPSMRGIALNPGTPLVAIEPLLDEVELVLLLAVNPGWPGQQFLDSTWGRMRDAQALIGERDIVLGVDGGITETVIPELVQRGADLVVTGSAVFSAATVRAGAHALMDALESGVTSRRQAAA